MAEQTSTQSQVTEAQNQQAQPGSEGSQADQATDAQTPGADGEVKQAAQTEKTYTAKEWSEREAAKDREIAGYREAFAQVALQRQIEQARAEEAQFAKIDQEAVEQGDITIQQAVERVQKRGQARQQEMHHEQQQMQQREVFNTMRTEGEKLGRILAAHDFGKKHGVDPDVLMHDASLKTPEQMEIKAERLALEKERAALKGSESYDSGQAGGAGEDLSGKSPMELTLAAYSPQETERRNKAKRR